MTNNQTNKKEQILVNSNYEKLLEQQVLSTIHGQPGDLTPDQVFDYSLALLRLMREGLLTSQQYVADYYGKIQEVNNG